MRLLSTIEAEGWCRGWSHEDYLYWYIFAQAGDSPLCKEAYEKFLEVMEIQMDSSMQNKETN